MKSKTSRRRFLSQAGLAGAGIAASSVFALPSYSQARGRTARPRWAWSRRARTSIRGCSARSSNTSGASIYTGVYDPGNPLSDERGFRKDVIKEVADLHVPIIRYPGGNMVSGYNWWDGVGPKKDRPTVLERAWNSLETNQFGTNDFMDWAKAVGTEPLLGFNLGTGTSEMAVAYIEYCNYAKGTKWSELRRSHGYDQPHKVKYWCLGNEMDGPWQMGRLTAREYGRKARDIAQQARVIDPDVQLIACGSSNTILPTYLTWDREVLEECYDHGRRHLAAQLLRQRARALGRQVRALPRAEPRHGAADPGDHRRGRLRAGPVPLAQEAVAVVRRVERLVSRAHAPSISTARASSRRNCSKRSTTSRTRCSPAASSTR